MEKAACERVAFRETRLASAREHLTRIKKRLKRMQDGQSPGTPQASPKPTLWESTHSSVTPTSQSKGIYGEFFY